MTNDSGAGQNDGDVLICSLPKKGVIGNAGCCWQLLAVVNDTTIWTNFLDCHWHSALSAIELFKQKTWAMHLEDER